MSWKKHFRTINNPLDSTALSTQHGNSATTSKFSSILPEIYAGHPNRIQRYYQYEDMARDSDIAAALDTIADFCTQSEEQNDSPFTIHYNETGTDAEIKILKQTLNQWVKTNGFKSKLWKTFRDCIQNGDAFFIRDPEDHSWIWIDHMMVELVKMSDDGKERPEEYVIRNFRPMVTEKLGTLVDDISRYRNPGMSSQSGVRPMVSSGASQFQMAGQERDQRNFKNGTIASAAYVAIKAENVVHLALAEERMGINFPFGQSILDPVFKTFKQKELLEDSIIIYRVQRAPERRVFYIDVGDMNPVRAQGYVEGLKNEIHQRRIPSRAGGGNQIMDAAYNPLCLSLDTRIPLLDGRVLTVAELGDEYRAGKQNWVYSCDPETGEVVPGNITWAGITRHNTEVIKLTFDNGETLTCTPDHKIPIWGKGFVEAKDITPEDSLISFERREKPVTSGSRNDYQQVFDHKSKSWIFTHRMVGEFFRKINNHQEYTFLPENTGKEKAVIHHKDFNRYNNDPRNLTYMNKEDHMSYHFFNKKEYWENITDKARAELGAKISDGLREYFSGMTTEQKTLYSEMRSVVNKKWITTRNLNNPEAAKEHYRKSGKGRARYLANNPDAKEKFAANAKTYAENYPNAKFEPNWKMVQLLVNTVKKIGGNRIDVLNDIANSNKYSEIALETNPITEKTNNKLSYDKMSDRQLKSVLKKFNYRNWKDFVSKVPVFNHRVVKIEKLDNMDTGTITVDGDERWHSHHTFAIEAGIFVKNSMLDDYFFAQSSGGRGSKVEVLPSGDCLALDTMIPLLDGRELALSDIIDEFAQGKNLWVYSCDPNTGEVVPGLVNWAGLTRLNTQVCQITLDNGETITVTPDHKFPTLARGTVEARDLVANDSLIPFNTKKEFIKPGKGNNTYTQIYDNKSKSWKFVHRMVAEYFRNHNLVKELTFCDDFKKSDKKVVHHIDFDRYNNNPENLSWVNYRDHWKYHSETLNKNFGHLAREGVRKFYDNMSAEEYKDYCKNISNRIRAAIANKSPEDMEQFRATSRKNFLKATEMHHWLLQNDDVWRKDILAKKSETMKKITSSPSVKKRMSLQMKKLWKEGIFNKNIDVQTIKFDQNVLNYTLMSIDRKTNTVKDLADKLWNDPTFKKMFLDLNKDTRAANLDWKNFELSDRHLRVLLKRNNIDFKKIISKNRNISSRMNTSQLLFKMLIDEAKIQNSMNGIIISLNSNKEFMNEYNRLNRNIHHLAGNKIHRSHIMTILHDFNYYDWKTFKSEISLVNHTVVKVEMLDDKINTGTLTIDGGEVYHNYHTFALSSGVFTFNSLGEITDLSYFTKKMARGLRIPTSYLPLGDDDQGAAYNDGKLGAAMIQEFRFNKFCMRIQNLLVPVFDKFFKEYISAKGISIDDNLFELQFNPPQNFTKYRQIELDLQQTQVYSSVAQNNRLSERFKLTRYLNMTDDEIVKNEELWAEENPDKMSASTGSTAAESNPQGDLGSVGFRPDSGGDDLNFDLPPDQQGEEVGGEDTSDTGSPPPPSGGSPANGETPPPAQGA